MTNYRIENRQKVYLNRTPVTLFQIFEQHSPGDAFIFTGQHSLPDWYASDEACLQQHQHCHMDDFFADRDDLAE